MPPRNDGANIYTDLLPVICAVGKAVGLVHVVTTDFNPLWIKHNITSGELRALWLCFFVLFIGLKPIATTSLVPNGTISYSVIANEVKQSAD